MELRFNPNMLVRTPGKMVEKQIHFGEFAREEEVLHSLPGTLLRDIVARGHDCTLQLTQRSSWRRLRDFPGVRATPERLFELGTCS
jgi:hypothetical protein